VEHKDFTIGQKFLDRRVDHVHLGCCLIRALAVSCEVTLPHATWAATAHARLAIAAMRLA
jgi:hypothetical protein